MWQKVATIKPKYIFSALGFALIAAAVPLTLNLNQQEQDIRQRAAEPTPVVCTADQPTDTMLIFDASGSMKEETSATDPTPRIERAQAAATAFVDRMAQRTASPRHLIGFSKFNSMTEVTLEQEMTIDYTRVKTAIANTTFASDTCTECGLKDALEAYNRDDRSNVKNVAILLSDGGATRYIGAQPPFTTDTHREAERRSVIAAEEMYNQYKTTIYTIGFGTDVRDGFLKEIATKTGGKYYFAPDAATLNQIYQDILVIIGKGEITGRVFNDINRNNIYDGSDQLLADQTIDLINPTTDARMKTMTTDDSGNYRFSSVCDGSYEVHARPFGQWTQISPQNPDYYPLTIVGGSVEANKDFGFGIVPTNTPTPTPTLTPTPVPNVTTLQFTVFLHGLGNAGDNANPNSSSLSNKNPIRRERPMTVEIFNNENQRIFEKNGILIYNSSAGNYTGSINLGENFSTGYYTVKITSEQYLTRRVPLTLNIRGNQRNTVPTINLVTGDVVGDNALNILDYNIIVGCYSDFAAPVACSSQNKSSSDITDDGKVNQFDYNLFLRDLSVQNGD